ncbi:hypothetical protein [Psychrobacter sp. P11G5]|uniref:hypothetical protein n=1 Tax=Psychrobacter sp. P11G5 TaxID=1699624 RepID=UPI000AB499AE|nr:hypothetical protein [Psychrobacter sp. P11G5]
MIFTFWNSKLDAVRSKNTIHKVTTVHLWRTPNLIVAILAGTLMLAGCQQQSETTESDNDSQISTQIDAENAKPAPLSDSAKARIEQFQPLYVAQMQGLQRRLQAEYEALQAADASDNENALLLDSASEPVDDTTNTNSPDSTVSATADPITNDADIEATNEVATNDAEVEINTSTEVGERDLEVLKRISLEPRRPKVLTEEEIIERYQQAMQALYEPATTALSAQDTDTLLNVATLVPQLFEHAEIAERVSVKSPALARLIIQHQVWQQIEAQQALDMQQMKLKQQQEFEVLMTKFNDTIKDYDEQIAKYEQTLQEFQ